MKIVLSGPERRARRAHCLFHSVRVHMKEGMPQDKALRRALVAWRDIVAGKRVCWFASLVKY